MTVRELLRRIGSDELSEWMAYSKLEPFGPVQEDLRAGYIAAQVACSWGGASRGPADYFPSIEECIPPETPAEAAAKARRSVIAMGGVIIDPKVVPSS